MKQNGFKLLCIRLLAVLAVIGLTVAPLAVPKNVLAADTLVSRGCPTNNYSDNLVLNPSFEDAHAGNSTPYIIRNTPGAVSGWTTLSFYSQMSVVLAANGYNTTQFAPNGWPVYDGDNEAVLQSFTTTGGLTAGSLFQPRPGLVGTLSAPTVMGTKYVLSARVSNVSNDLPVYVANVGSVTAVPVAIEMRLRNSTTHAESAPIQAIIPNHFQSGGSPDGHEWGLISGTITADQVYDRVVIRHYQDTGFAFIDDVVVCRAAAPTPWWKAHAGLAGLSVALLAVAAMLVYGGFVGPHTHRGSKRRKTRGSNVAVGDFNSDGVLDKITENESPWPTARIFLRKNKLLTGAAAAILTAAAVYIASANGGIWKSVTNPIDTASKGSSSIACAKGQHIKTVNMVAKCVTDNSIKTATKTPAQAKTCTDQETAVANYKVFRNSTYKYCIQYPSVWEVTNSDPSMVTFGKVPTGEPGPGWLKATYFTNKTVTMRAEEIMNNYKEPAGPCKSSNATLAGQSAKRLDCTGAANGEDHVYVLLGRGHDVVELSYVEGMGEQKASYDSKYKVMVESFLFD